MKSTGKNGHGRQSGVNVQSMHMKTIIFSDKTLTFLAQLLQFFRALRNDKPSPFFIWALMLLAPLSELAVRQLWSPSQCFFGAQMTELGPTFKDNCLIGVFSYAVGSWGPGKGSDNSVIMRLQQIYAFAVELWRTSWQPRAPCMSTLPPWTPRYSWGGAPFNENTWVFVCVVVWVGPYWHWLYLGKWMRFRVRYAWIQLGSRCVWKK